jgi:hypothetical protein
MRSLLLALASLGLAGMLVGSGGAATAKDPSTTFLDPTGEDPAAPDITRVVVSNSVGGLVTFRVTIPNRPRMTHDMRISLWIDADQDQATGLGEKGPFIGADYYVNWDHSQRPDATLLRCGPTSCTTVFTNTFKYAYASGATFTLHAADLGETRGFRFAVRAYSGADVPDLSKARIDYAPQEGAAWTYRLASRPAALVPQVFAKTLSPRAGGTFKVHLVAGQPGGAAVTAGRVSCRATVGGVRLQPRTERFLGKRATCVFSLPADASGKTIRGSITVFSEGLRLTKTFRSRIR